MTSKRDSSLKVFRADFGARCVRFDKVAVFSVHKRFTIDLM